MPIIKFKNVCKQYQRKTILKNINLEISTGEFFGLIGANGAGKTTLIKCLLDLCEIDEGCIQISKIEHTKHYARTEITFLPEQFSPPHYLTGQHFLTYIAKLHGYSYISVQVETSCKTLDFDIVALKQSVRYYSKGMIQKIGLIASFLSKKQLLIFDEPMNGLDPKARAYFKNHLKVLKTQNTTLFFSTHLLTDIEILCDRIAILHKG